MTHRFFVSPENIRDGQIQFPADLSHQINRVLRLKIGDLIVVLDNQGYTYSVELSDVNPDQCQGNILERKPASGEPTVRLHLYVALSQREKFEWILQKTTEIGVAHITPMISERSLVQKREIVNQKGSRWEKIIREAAEQSQRGKIPVLNPPLTFSQVIQQKADLMLLAWENERSRGLAELINNKDHVEIALMIGPEGGFSEEEIHQAISMQWIPFSLGKRILRMETAAIVASALILYESGDLLT